MTTLESPESNPVWWLGTYAADTARVKARLATEAHKLASVSLGHPHFSAVLWRKDPDQSEHETRLDPEQAPTEPPPPPDAVEINMLVAAVERAKQLCRQFDDASQFALNLARECVELSDEAKCEWLLERAALLEENARLRAELQQWRTGRETDDSECSGGSHSVCTDTPGILPATHPFWTDRKHWPVTHYQCKRVDPVSGNEPTEEVEEP
jgi:hypothetical protein